MKLSKLVLLAGLTVAPVFALAEAYYGKLVKVVPSVSGVPGARIAVVGVDDFTVTVADDTFADTDAVSRKAGNLGTVQRLETGDIILTGAQDERKPFKNKVYVITEANKEDLDNLLTLINQYGGTTNVKTGHAFMDGRKFPALQMDPDKKAGAAGCKVFGTLKSGFAEAAAKYIKNGELLQDKDKTWIVTCAVFVNGNSTLGSLG